MLSYFGFSLFIQLLTINLVFPAWFGRASHIKSSFLNWNILIFLVGLSFVFFIQRMKLVDIKHQFAAVAFIGVFQLLALFGVVKHLQALKKMPLRDSNFHSYLTVNLMKGIALFSFLISFVFLVSLAFYHQEFYLPKFVILSVSCCFLIFQANNILSFEHSEHETVRKHKEEFKAKVLLILASILPIYFSLKEVLFLLDAHDVRPIMMSIFIQITLFATVPSLIIAENSREK